jgi:hypothetical protein
MIPIASLDYLQSLFLLQLLYDFKDSQHQFYPILNLFPSEYRISYSPLTFPKPLIYTAITENSERQLGDGPEGESGRAKLIIIFQAAFRSSPGLTDSKVGS